MTQQSVDRVFLISVLLQVTQSVVRVFFKLDQHSLTASFLNADLLYVSMWNGPVLW